MKKIFFPFLFVLACVSFVNNDAIAATPWWLQPTICREDPTNCYAGMGAGFDSGMWDVTSKCWGLKLVCANALNQPPANAPTAMGKLEIASAAGINTDFDTTVLNNDCFGARKTIASGSMASVGGVFVKVWCNGVLANSDEQMPTGEIKYGTQPTCKTLAQNDYVGALNNRCYGKYYSSNNYYIECEGNNESPKRLIVLNGADKVIGVGSAPAVTYPTTMAAAKNLFDKMQAVSAAKKATHL